LHELSVAKEKPEGNIFLVEKVLDHEIRNNGHYYLVKWEGYPEEDNTWEPESNLIDCYEHIVKFFN